jgi:hypothetical protein
MSPGRDTLDSVLPEAIRRMGAELAWTAVKVQPEKIRERKYMQPAFRAALTCLVGDTVLPGERRLEFKHWQGIPERPRIGGIDVSVVGAVAGTWRAFIELKWCPLDGEFLGWAIWDFFKMATGRVSPGADSCYLIAGAQAGLWARQGTVGELFSSRRWDTADVLRRHNIVWTGDDKDCPKLTALPLRIDSILVADENLPPPLEDWIVKAIRVEPVERDDSAWLALVEGQLPTPGGQSAG